MRDTDEPCKLASVSRKKVTSVLKFHIPTKTQSHMKSHISMEKNIQNEISKLQSKNECKFEN